MSLADAVLAGLAAAGCLEAWFLAEPLAPARAYLEACRGRHWLISLLTCPFCLSFHAGLFWTGWLALGPTQGPGALVWRAVASALAAGAVARFVARDARSSLFDRSRDDV